MLRSLLFNGRSGRVTGGGSGLLHVVAALAAVTLLSACGAASAPDGATPPPAAADPTAAANSDPESIVRTGDPYTRGFTDADFPRVQQIADGVYTYEQLRSAGEEKFTTVSMFVVTDAGVLVADGQGEVEETTRMIEEIGKITEQPITHVIICSDHGDHTAGNSAFPHGAVFYAHPTSDATLRASAANPHRGEDAALVIVADVLATDEVTDIELGGRSIQLLFLGRAHTGGDLSVYLPDDKILFMSEAYLNRIFPAMRSAYPSEWVAMIEKAQALDVDIYIPGHGFVESPPVLVEELETYRGALVQVIDEATRLHEAGLTVDEAADQAQFGDLDTWTLRSSQGPTAIRRVFLELNGGLPPVKRDRQ